MGDIKFQDGRCVSLCNCFICGTCYVLSVALDCWCMGLFNSKDFPNGSLVSYSLIAYYEM